MYSVSDIKYRNNFESNKCYINVYIQNKRCHKLNAGLESSTLRDN